MSTKAAGGEKGGRTEREARDIIGRVYGSGNVDKVHRFTNNDPLGFIDVLAAKEGYPVRFVQVKSNRFTSEHRRQYAQRIAQFPEGVVCEVWVRIDRSGWRIHRFNRATGEYEEVLRMDTCDIEATVEAFREEADFYEIETSSAATSDTAEMESGS